MVRTGALTVALSAACILSFCCWQRWFALAHIWPADKVMKAGQHRQLAAETRKNATREQFAGNCRFHSQRGDSISSPPLLLMRDLLLCVVCAVLPRLSLAPPQPRLFPLRGRQFPAAATLRAGGEARDDRAGAADVLRGHAHSRGGEPGEREDATTTQQRVGSGDR